jgi:hypothetical protein
VPATLCRRPAAAAAAAAAAAGPGRVDAHITLLPCLGRAEALGPGGVSCHQHRMGSPWITLGGARGSRGAAPVPRQPNKNGRDLAVGRTCLKSGRKSTVAAQCIHSRPHTVSVWSCLGRAEAPGPAAAVDAISLHVSERHGLVFGAAAVRRGVSCRRRHRRRRQLTTPVPPAHHTYPGICKFTSTALRYTHGMMISTAAAGIRSLGLG